MLIDEMTPKFEPLSMIWDKYVANVEVATLEGQLNDPDLAQDVIYPAELFLAESERADVRRYISDRMEEVVAKINLDKALDPNHLAIYLFRTLVCGMQWQNERIGH